MVGLTREQRLAKNCKMLDDQVENVLADYDFDLIGDTSTMVLEIQQELITLLPKKASPKIKTWGYNAIDYACGSVFSLQIHTMRVIDKRPYLALRVIRMDADMRNLGYGTAILKILIEKSKQCGRDGVQIECIESPAMEHVATKLGFERIGDTKDFILRTKEA